MHDILHDKNMNVVDGDVFHEKGISFCFQSVREAITTKDFSYTRLPYNFMKCHHSFDFSSVDALNFSSRQSCFCFLRSKTLQEAQTCPFKVLVLQDSVRFHSLKIWSLHFFFF